MELETSRVLQPDFVAGLLIPEESSSTHIYEDEEIYHVMQLPIADEMLLDIQSLDEDKIHHLKLPEMQNKLIVLDIYQESFQTFYVVLKSSIKKEKNARGKKEKGKGEGEGGGGGPPAPSGIRAREGERRFKPGRELVVALRHCRRCTSPPHLFASPLRLPVSASASCLGLCFLLLFLLLASASAFCFFLLQLLLLFFAFASA
ncbi:uncharacterized protein DS421_16g551720 [Arachis hypogaea]|nr:uncharacterized protein DS421_16g551720 [Arachis hypogaea]